MILLAILLAILGIIKLIIVYTLREETEIPNISSMDSEELRDKTIKFFLFEGLVEIICGIYMLL